VPTLLADDFFHARFMLGSANSSWRDLDLARLDAEVLLDGERHGGNTDSVLGAIDSLQWLARKLAQNGRRLKAGDIVLTGSIVPPVPVHTPPVTLELRIEGFEPLTLGAGP
jgi:2-keto-4-pentenoate hydratase